MNKSYIKCLEKKLPCQCEEEIQNYFVMNLDTCNYVISLLKYDLNEEKIYKIIRETKNCYRIVDVNKNNDLKIDKITIKNEELIIQELSGNKLTFKRYGVAMTTNRIDYFSKNISLINKALAKRGYDNLEIILNEKLLNCNCNNDLGELNFIWNEAMTESWSIEIVEDSLIINKILIMELNDSIITKRKVSYKW
jgi:hypothetical protein